MKNLLCTLAALGAISVAPLTASAADLGGYEDRETYVERPARIIERERIVEHQYYDPRYDERRDYEEPEVYYAPSRACIATTRVVIPPTTRRAFTANGITAASSAAAPCLGIYSSSISMNASQSCHVPREGVSQLLLQPGGDEVGRFVGIMKDACLRLFRSWQDFSSI